ncbi:type II toxin-antitoxin system RelE/ParE family toxin [Fodinibius halophilus]|uniref:Type II toxin-antitoxin system RelE/ParE family toxin n=1 Tax=Fodinibius halophilus TaxID=1736908 RepID=A0A6M1T9R8_9BACT|nr:type II toxin-antitoxin system RelE/ParE family toxin [Fodinibius halophilus]
MTLHFHPEAEHELHQSVEYYENKAAGLGDEFLNEVEKTLRLIKTYPNLGFPLTNSDRRMIVQRFPYGLIYSVQNDRIDIYALMHLHRRPGYWKSRK